MYWWMKDENYKGDIVHTVADVRLKVYYRSRFPDDDTYAIVVEEEGQLKIMAFLWLGEIVDPRDPDRQYFWED